MTNSDLPAFLETWRGLQRVFPLRGDPSELGQVQSAYFAALRRFTLDQVQAGAERALMQQKHFPKPAEWIDLVPRQTAAVELEALSEVEAHAWLRAERLRWADSPCTCAECRSVGMNTTPRRFVPLFDADDREVRARIGDREVVRGEWIHGERLLAWSLAREQAESDLQTLLGLNTMPRFGGEHVHTYERTR